MNRIRALKVIQNEREILLFSMPASELLEISYFNPRELDRENGIQREFKVSKSKEIAEYLLSDDAVLVNNIIINFNLKKMGLKIEDVYNNGYLDMEKIVEKYKSINMSKKKLKDKIAFVIDGQHRLRAFNYIEDAKFPLMVAAFYDLTLAEMAEIFVKINYYQRPVNKSLVLDLLGISKNIFPEYYLLHGVTEKLNEDIESPFYNNIKMLGVGNGFVSQASIIRALDDYKIEETLRKLDIKPNRDVLYDLIWNYFKGFESAFPEYWGKGAMFSSAMGIRALFRLMVDLLTKYDEEGRQFESSKIAKDFRQNVKMNFLNEHKGIGGEKGAKILYDNLKLQMKLGGDANE